jgi:superfamily II DNA/RNA helicase
MMENFSQLGVMSCFLSRLKERGISEATDIQKKIIPLLAAGESVLFTSATGTGKTFAYLLPILSCLLEQRTQEPSRKESGSNPSFVIVAPTLELCTQIKSELDFLLADTDICSLLLIGSISLDRQIEELKKTKPDIIIGNHGRLLVLAKMGKLNFSSLKFLVLDEADRLVSGEMLDETSELCKIIYRTNKTRNVHNTGDSPVFAACSATMNKKCREKLINNCINPKNASFENIKFIESEDNEILYEKIEHWAIFSEKRRKDQTLRSLLAALNAKKSKVKALIFTSRSDEALFVFSRLQHHHVPAAGLFGKVSKKPVSGEARKEALDSFREGKVTALVSTDLAARGLDIPGITHVIALDVPADTEVYIHRCGRTGRAGKRGTMVTIGDETQMHLLAALEKKLKIKVYPKELHYGKVCVPAPIEE